MSSKIASLDVSINSILDGFTSVGYKQHVAVPKGPFYRVLGQRLRDARCEAGITQVKLANTVGLSRSSIANMERGRQPIYIHALVSIIRQLGIPLSDLIPPEQEADEHNIESELNKLGTPKRHWVVGIINPPTNQEKEENGTKVCVIKKARHAIAAESAGKKAAGSSRKTRDHAKGGDKTSALLR